jgi:hypothetical protein
MRDLRKADRIMVRKWRRLPWRDPRADLVNLGLLYAQLLRHGVLVKHDDLRERSLKRFLEQKQAALFAHLIGEAILNAPIAYAMVEEEDYDCVLWFKVDGTSRYSRVQLKDAVPPSINPHATIDRVLASLSKYSASSQTIVAHPRQPGGTCRSLRARQAKNLRGGGLVVLGRGA